MPLKDFIRGPGSVGLRQGEILTGIWLKKDAGFNLHHFEKVGTRNALAIAVVSLAALIDVSEAGIINKARLAWGSVSPVIAVCSEAEKALAGRPLCQKTLEGALPLIRAEVSPIDDIRATAEFRRTVAGNLLLRLVELND